ncbi:MULTISPECIES: hypothetical protein [Methylosinus]|uniref:J domain-containing protein n=1 Tax=Methylosinus trichosporium (strain ATCC 35070 / NCIMB 11131 / UNIQEM 75 / OB3b) TaxID=595536 RepID=A0A2D2D3M5_METT3|nr:MULTISPECIES: hypothetical protein [Methylosinus]ATQ69556.1 hypothetical protein CQW49_17980 [Methylosinus trichosporium OB3b]OBS50481.1 hypothetical protein A8B73_21210 [Methylosinus sp. 3S-1]
MRADTALFHALELAIAPRLAARLRRRPLPDDVLEVIRIAAGCDATLEQAATLVRREPKFVKAAAQFYVLQIVLHPGADCYRMLGVREGASRDVMRLHLRWLLLWLHPDRSDSEWRSGYARMVLAAWREVGGHVAIPSCGSRNDIQAPMLASARRSIRKRIPHQRKRHARVSRWIVVAALLVAALSFLGPVRFSDLATAQGETLNRRRKVLRTSRRNAPNRVVDVQIETRFEAVEAR